MRSAYNFRPGPLSRSDAAALTELSAALAALRFTGAPPLDFSQTSAGVRASIQTAALREVLSPPTFAQVTDGTVQTVTLPSGATIQCAQAALVTQDSAGNWQNAVGDYLYAGVWTASDGQALYGLPADSGQNNLIDDMPTVWLYGANGELLAQDVRYPAVLAGVDTNSVPIWAAVPGPQLVEVTSATAETITLDSGTTQGFAAKLVGLSTTGNVAWLRPVGGIPSVLGEYPVVGQQWDCVLVAVDQNGVGVWAGRLQDHKSLVDSNDAGPPGYLADKIVVTGALSKTILNVNGNEQLQLGIADCPTCLEIPLSWACVDGVNTLTTQFLVFPCDGPPYLSDTNVCSSGSGSASGSGSGGGGGCDGPTFSYFCSNACFANSYTLTLSGSCSALTGTYTVTSNGGTPAEFNWEQEIDGQAVTFSLTFGSGIVYGDLFINGGGAVGSSNTSEYSCPPAFSASGSFTANLTSIGCGASETVNWSIT